MRFAAALVTLSAFVAAVPAAMIFQRQSIPTCAETCLENASLGGCQEGDDTCLCNNEAFINSTTSCIQSTCTGQDLTTAEYDAQQLCLAVGVTLTTSGAASTSTSNSTSSGSSSSNNGAVSNSISILAGAAAVALGAALL